jgi:hypothetical protein
MEEKVAEALHFILYDPFGVDADVVSDDDLERTRRIARKLLDKVPSLAAYERERPQDREVERAASTLLLYAKLERDGMRRATTAETHDSHKDRAEFFDHVASLLSQPSVPERPQLTAEEAKALAWAAGWMQLHADKALNDYRYNLLDSARNKLRVSPNPAETGDTDE